MIIQIYGIRTLADARMVIDSGAHHIGVSYGQIKRTPGQLSIEEAEEIFAGVQPEAVKVGLTVSLSLAEIISDMTCLLPDVLHLSGEMTALEPVELKELKWHFPTLKLMLAVPVLAKVPLEEQPFQGYLSQYEGIVDYLLIDTKAPGTSDIGATGLSHDWEIDRWIVANTSARCIIAGGLGPDNVARAIQSVAPYGVDSFTSTNLADLSQIGPGQGIKDPEKVRQFIEAVRYAK